MSRASSTSSTRPTASPSSSCNTSPVATCPSSSKSAARSRSPRPPTSSSQACEAIHEAHSIDIVHRDLKPGNLFVTTGRDGTPLVKVLDFGISKTADASDMSMTASTSVLGSPLYMSPEQLLTPKDVGPRSDVWSLGVILYEMLTAETPFGGTTLPAVAWAIQRGTYRPVRDTRADVPEALEQLVADTLVTDPEKRLPDVASFAARLAPFGTGAAQDSYALIQRVALQSHPPHEPSSESANATPPSRKLMESERRPSGPATMAESIHDSRATTNPRPNRWGRVAAIGVVAAAAASAFAIPRFRHMQAAPSSSSADAAVADLAGDAASGTSEHPAPDNAGSTAPPTADPAIGATPAPVASTGTSAGAPPAAASARAAVPPSASATGCAGGATAECEAACAAHSSGRGLKERCVQTALSKIAGNGVTKDVKGGLGQLDALCTKREVSACEALQSLYTRGYGADIPADPLLQQQYAKKACDLGSTTACGTEKLLANVGAAKESMSVFNQKFQTACDNGDMSACGMLGEDLIAGIGISVDREKGVALLKKACAGQFDRSCKKLAAIGAQ
jgi:TPR repeat protein